MQPQPPQEEVPMVVLIIVILSYTAPIWMLLGTWIIGKMAEKKHYQSIRERESAWVHIPALTGKQVPELPTAYDSQLVVGSVVVSVDHFKRWLSKFRMIFGGEMKSYASVIDRGRREAILRMKEACPDADMFLNCRLETSTVSNGKGNAVGCAEVLAYGTAVRLNKTAE